MSILWWDSPWPLLTTRWLPVYLQAFRQSVGGLFAMTNLTKSSSGKPVSAAAPEVPEDVREKLLQGTAAPSVADLLVRGWPHAHPGANRPAGSCAASMAA